MTLGEFRNITRLMGDEVPLFVSTDLEAQNLPAESACIEPNAECNGSMLVICGPREQ